MMIALFFVCLLMVAWVTAGAMAVRSASRIWLRHWAEQRLRGAASVMMYLERPQRLLASAHTGVALTVGFVGLWIGWRSANQGIAMLGLAGYAAIVILFGHLVPRAIARRWPSVVIPVTMPVLRVVEVATAPLLHLGRSIAGVREAPNSLSGHDAIQDLLREGEMEGVGRRDEIAIISGVMEFGVKHVRDVMTPRRDIFAVPQHLDPKSTAAVIAESAFSRVPAYKDSLDQIVGMYHAFDVLKTRPGQLPPLRPVASAPADTPCNELLFRMLKARQHLAVVHDERRQTLGIVTLENLLEELVGDIRDEHDDPASATPSGIPSL
ncbi:MAG TPA: CBS domain-containing protein [Gemmatimonadaceae bacterium]|nr:CBS domain-containing protein [Gemmatimonadaceae bacterium]